MHLAESACAAEDAALFTSSGKHDIEAHAPSVVAAVPDHDFQGHGFASASQYTGIWKDVGGRHLLDAHASVLDTPLHPDGPLVFWELRGFFYALGFSEKSGDTARWFRQKANKKQIAKMSELFHVDHEMHFRHSRKQMAAKDPQ
jgi:hypothetical protein